MTRTVVAALAALTLLPSTAAASHTTSRPEPFLRAGEALLLVHRAAPSYSFACAGRRSDAAHTLRRRSRGVLECDGVKRRGDGAVCRVRYVVRKRWTGRYSTRTTARPLPDFSYCAER